MKYKFYIGQYTKNGFPPLTFIETSNEYSFEKTLKELVDVTPYGMDIYIEYPDKNIKSYYKEIKKKGTDYEM